MQSDVPTRFREFARCQPDAERQNNCQNSYRYKRNSALACSQTYVRHVSSSHIRTNDARSGRSWSNGVQPLTSLLGSTTSRTRAASTRRANASRRLRSAAYTTIQKGNCHCEQTFRTQNAIARCTCITARRAATAAISSRSACAITQQCHDKALVGAYAPPKLMRRGTSGPCQCVKCRKLDSCHASSEMLHSVRHNSSSASRHPHRWC
jgi:hypothetical protein